MKKLLIIALALTMTISLIGCNTSNSSEQQEIQPSTINAGYISYAPGFIVDPNTGERSGIFHDILQEIAKRNNITVNYTEEVTRATLVEVLDTNRVDIIATPVWMTEQRIVLADFSDPVYFSPIGTYVHVDSTLSSLGEINTPSVSIAAVDGEGGEAIAREFFPQATLETFPNNVDVSQMLLQVATKKQDVIFAEPIFVYEFLQKNPDTLKNIAETDPVQERANAFMVKLGDTELQTLLNTTLQELEDDGTLDRIIDTYIPFEGAILKRP